jgi:DNA-binding transcriptional ArsR family regulator
MRRDVFQAIADPTRRAIINMIANENMNLNSVAERFDISRPAISKHIKILTECGLVTINVQGREHYCEARLEKLNEVNEWVAQYKKFWEDKFDALEKYLMELQAKPSLVTAESARQSASRIKKSTRSNKNRFHKSGKPDHESHQVPGKTKPSSRKRKK